MAALDRFREGGWSSRPIRDLGLGIAGTPLEPIVEAFQPELEAAGIRRLRPQFYLSTEWGVNFGTIAIGIPFYLARPELTAIHAERSATWKAGTARSCSVISAMRWGTSSITLTSSMNRRTGRSSLDRWHSRTRRTIAPSRSAGGSWVICQAGTQMHPDEDWADCQ